MVTAVRDAAANLPGEPIAALMEFGRRASAIYAGLPGEFSRDDAAFVVTFVRGFSERYNLIALPANRGTNQEDAVMLLSVISQFATHNAERLSEEAAQAALAQYSDAVDETTFGVAKLNEEEKKSILSHLEKARVIVERSQLSDRKKNALFGRLAELHREVNLTGTRTDRFFALAGDTAFVLGAMAANAKPFLQEVKEILKIVGRSRARQEGVSLPPGDETLRLPSPSDEEG